MTDREIDAVNAYRDAIVRHREAVIAYKRINDSVRGVGQELDRAMKQLNIATDSLRDILSEGLPPWPYADPLAGTTGPVGEDGVKGEPGIGSLRR